MSQARDEGRTLTTADRDVSRADAAAAPGRAARSGDLVGPNGPLPSGLIQRKARDANGVQEGAGDAVARASSSSGAALPETLMRKFESSLGADLSGVRVHTGGESADAASAVGAKAYTLGQDIHFGAGHFDPSSSTGEHLLAHEVAHTVQQRGGTAHRQNKLEVSSVGDAFEVEADRAADAMVAGNAFGVSSADGVLARKGTPAAEHRSEEEGGEGKKKNWPSVKDQSVSMGLLGGKMGFSWKEGSAASHAWEKGADIKTKKEYAKEVQFAPGVVGRLGGGVGASLGAHVSASIEGSSHEATGTKAGPRLDENAMTMRLAASGGGSVEAKAEGNILVAGGVGIANLASLTAGAKLGLEASASIGVKVGGAIEATGDDVDGELFMSVKGGLEVKATGSFVIDANLPDDSINLYTYTLGEFPIAKVELEAEAKYSGGAPTTVFKEPTFEFLPIPPPPQRQKREMSAAEKKRYQEAHRGEGGASGARSSGMKDKVEMTDDELLTQGKQQALNNAAKWKGNTVAVFDGGSAGAFAEVIIDERHVAANVTIPQSEKIRWLEHGKEITKVTRGQITAVTLGSVSDANIMASKPNTVDQVATLILDSRGVQVEVTATAFAFKDVPMKSCKVHPEDYDSTDYSKPPQATDDASGG